MSLYIYEKLNKRNILQTVILPMPSKLAVKANSVNTRPGLWLTSEVAANQKLERRVNGIVDDVGDSFPKKMVKQILVLCQNVISDVFHIILTFMIVYRSHDEIVSDLPKSTYISIKCTKNAILTLSRCIDTMRAWCL